jgi:hypothetical protein
MDVIKRTSNRLLENSSISIMMIFSMVVFKIQFVSNSLFANTAKSTLMFHHVMDCKLFFRLAKSVAFNTFHVALRILAKLQVILEIGCLGEARIAELADD